MARRPWTVLPHGPIKAVAENLWCVEGKVPNMAFGRRMTVIRLADGRLVIHSAIALDDTTRSELEALGTPAFVIVPNQWHRMDANGFKERYPSIKVLCPEAVQKAVQKQVDVDGDWQILPDDPHLGAEALRGCKEAAFIATSGESSSLLLNDAVLNLPDRLPGFGGFVTKLLGSTGGPKVTPVAKWGIVTDSALLASHFRELAELPNLKRIIVSHGEIIDKQPAQVLRDVAKTLYATR